MTTARATCASPTGRSHEDSSAGEKNKHQAGFDRLRSEVAQKYGVQLQAGNDGQIRVRDISFGFGAGFGNTAIGKLPPVMDQEQKRKIMAIDENGFHQHMLGLLGPKKTNRLVQRLRKLKAHVQSSKCMVIPTGAWGTQVVTDKFTRGNSLVGRDARPGFDPSGLIAIMKSST